MTAKEVIERALAAMIGGEGDDGEIAGALAAAGVDPDLAREAIAFIPLAFGRVAFDGRGPQFSRRYRGDDSEHLLADHPLYVEALAVAGSCGGDLFKEMVLRSSETNAINAAAHAGTALEDMVVGAPVMGFDAAKGRAKCESSTRVLLGPESRDAEDKVREVFAAHGAEGVTLAARVFTGTVRASSTTLQLDVEVGHPLLGERTILESAGGIGAGVDEAIANAFEKFCRGALHPIMAALVAESHGGDQVEIEERPGWRAIMGLQLRQMKVPDSFDYGPLLDALLDRWLASKPTDEIHWMRLFYMRGPEGPYGFDVLVNNEVWQEGADIVTGWSWPWEGDPYAIRHFLVLAPS